MKSARFASKNNEQANNAIKIKALETDKKGKFNNKSDYNTTEVLRPGSCPTNNSTWVPSRNWHKYLSNQQQPPRPSVPAAPRPYRLHTLSPRNKANWPDSVKPKDLLLVKPPDELFTINLPSVNFCGEQQASLVETTTREALSIKDLCDDDKRKIAQLVEELARCKQVKEEDEERILALKNKVSELKTLLSNLTVSRRSDDKSATVPKSIETSEQAALKKQLNELNQLLVQMQVQKATSEVQVKTITERAERMTRALHALHRENTELTVELRVAKEKLSLAYQAVEKMSKEIKVVQENIKPVTEDKACQSSEDFGVDKVTFKSIEVSEKLPEDQQILTELFFNKSLAKSHFPQKETIIFLPPDYNEKFDEA